MAGAIRVFQKCKRCGSRFVESGDEFACPDCGNTPDRYVVDIHYRGQRPRIYTDKTGMVLDTLARANRVLESARYEIDHGTFDPAQYIKRDRREFEFHPKIKEWEKDYENAVEKGDISPSYLKEVRRFVNNYFIPHFSNTDIRDIKTRQIKDFFKKLPKHLSAKSRSNIKSALHKFFTDMADDELVPALPKFPDITIPEKTPKWIDMETQEDVLAHIPEVHWPVMWFTCKQGVRPGESRALQWEDLDLDNDMVCIRHNYSLNELREITKGKKEGWIPLHPIVKELILQLPRGFTGHVFKYKGRPYSESMMRKLWNAARKEVRVDVTLYQGSRHSIASDAVERGLSLYDVKEALRHSDIRTAQKYAHADLASKKRVILDSGKKIVKLRKMKNRL